jgi:hypothetical protein
VNRSVPLPVSGMAPEEPIDGSLLPVLGVSILACLLLLYVRGILQAYRAAGDGWRTMDRDVRFVFLLVVPLFRGGIQVLLWIDRLFYTPKSETKVTKQWHSRSSGL